MRRLHELCTGEYLLREDAFLLPGYQCYADRKVRVNILAMGDVGGTLTLAMRLCGGDIVRRIGICDIDPNMASR